MLQWLVARPPFVALPVHPFPYTERRLFKNETCALCRMDPSGNVLDQMRKLLRELRASDPDAFDRLPIPTAPKDEFPQRDSPGSIMGFWAATQKFKRMPGTRVRRLRL